MHQDTRCATLPTSDVRARVMAAVFFAMVTVVAAKIRIPLPFTPVPVTLQVLAALLSGLVLGSRLGAASQLLYLGIGFAGVPVFAGNTGGFAIVAGPTGGYLLGFIFGAYAAGTAFERLGKRTHAASWVAGLVGIIAIYAVGSAWLAMWLGCTGSKSWASSIAAAWYMGVAPFIGIDLLKAVAASGLALGLNSGRGMVETFRRLGC